MKKLFTLLHQQATIHSAHEKSKVVPAEQFSQLLSAEEILSQAEKELELGRIALEEERERVLEKAKKEGTEEGLKQFHDLLTHFDRQMQQVRHEVSRQILPIAIKAARKIVGRQLDLHPDTIIDIVRQALAPITENKHIILYVNKQDREHLEARKPELAALLPQIESFSVQESNDIEPGGCRIWTESGFLNVELETQWRVLEKALKQYFQYAPS